MRLEYMFAAGLNKEEYNDLLITGWRRFGYFFFRPKCDICFECIPIRILVDKFTPSKSQRRVINKNENTIVKFNHLRFTDEIYEIYREHSLDRFNQKVSKNDFKQSFFINAVSAMQSEYYIDNKLIAVGFIDISNEAFSSVYFIYKTAFDNFSLGTFSVIKEIEYAKTLGLKYYNLGYYVKNNKRMSYKNKFRPYELYDWHKNIWEEME